METNEVAEAENPETIRLARMLYDALRAADPEAFMTGADDLKDVVIDGNFDLVAVARKLRG